MNQITPEQLLAKIGMLVMEIDILRQEIARLQKELIEKKKQENDNG